MPRKSKKKKKSEFDIVHATVDQIDNIKKEVTELENMLKADKASAHPKIQDEKEFRAFIQQKKKILKDHTPRRMKGAKANKAYAEAKKLKKEIQEHMLSSKQFDQHYPKSSRGEHDFERSVRQQVAFQSDRVLKRKVQHFRHIMRRLEPSNPELSSIERLRK